MLLLPVQRANMRLTVNILIGAHLTLVSVIAAMKLKGTCSLEGKL